MKDLLAQNAKAIVPLVVAGALLLFAAVGVTGDMTVKEVLTLAVTSALVWLTRNRV